MPRWWRTELCAKLLLHETNGFAALHIASQEGQLEAVRSLIRAGADVNFDRGSSPIICAAGSGHAAVVQALAEARADVNFARAMNRVTALLLASQEGRETAVRALLSLGADPRQENSEDCMALLIAMLFDHPSFVALPLVGWRLEVSERVSSQKVESIQSLHVNKSASLDSFLSCSPTHF